MNQLTVLVVDVQRGHESDEGGRGGENQVVHGADLDPEAHSEGRHHVHRRHQGQTACLFSMIHPVN